MTRFFRKRTFLSAYFVPLILHNVILLIRAKNLFIRKNHYYPLIIPYKNVLKRKPFDVLYEDLTILFSGDTATVFIFFELRRTVRTEYRNLVSFHL